MWIGYSTCSLMLLSNDGSFLPCPFSELLKNLTADSTLTVIFPYILMTLAPDLLSLLLLLRFLKLSVSIRMIHPMSWPFSSLNSSQLLLSSILPQPLLSLSYQFRASYLDNYLLFFRLILYNEPSNNFTKNILQLTFLF